jgi:hypothetical protein
MSRAEISFTPAELHLLNDAHIWQLKASLNDKLYKMFSEVESEAKDLYSDAFQKNIDTPAWSAKISRGENYLGHPYVILDAPNTFSKNEIFAVRNWVWFGHYAASFLVVSGRPLAAFIEKLKKIQHPIEGLYICIYDNPWQHHFESDNMILFKGPHQINESAAFIKIGFKHSLSDASSLKTFFLKNYSFYGGLIS